MLRIRKSCGADTRSAGKRITKDILLQSSKQHINDVVKAMDWMRDIILEKSLKHDFTKIEYINEFYDDFSYIQATEFGDFCEMNWYKNIHLEKERHHLDRKVPNDVNLFDILERVADITMAGMGRNGYVYMDELDPDVLQRAYKNTVELLKSQIVVID